MLPVASVNESIDTVIGDVISAAKELMEEPEACVTSSSSLI